MSEYRPRHRGEHHTLLEERSTLQHGEYLPPRHLESSPPPKSPGHVRRLRSAVLDSLSPGWSRSEALTAVALFGGYLAILGGYVYYQLHPSQEDGDYQPPADYYVQLKVPKHGSTFEEMMERYGRRHYGWTHRQADEAADNLAQDLGVETTDPQADSSYIFDASQPLKPGETLRVPRFLLRLEDQMVSPPASGPMP